MIEWLNDIDTELLLFLNGFHNSFFDTLMYYVSQTFTWIPFYILLIFFILKKQSYRNGAIALLFLIISVSVADFFSVHLFKEVFQRLRPCHNGELQGLIHLVRNKCGGMYGFISSHASNTFAVAMFVSLFFKNKYVWMGMFLWSTIISYSRIYLGVHYPGDVIAGALWGMTIAFIVFKIYIFLDSRNFKFK